MSGISATLPPSPSLTLLAPSPGAACSLLPVAAHQEIFQYNQSTSNVHAKLLQNFRVLQVLHQAPTAASFCNSATSSVLIRFLVM